MSLPNMLTPPSAVNVPPQTPAFALSISAPLDLILITPFSRIPLTGLTAPIASNTPLVLLMMRSVLVLIVLKLRLSRALINPELTMLPLPLKILMFCAEMVAARVPAAVTLLRIPATVRFNVPGIETKPPLVKSPPTLRFRFWEE